MKKERRLQNPLFTFTAHKQGAQSLTPGVIPLAPNLDELCAFANENTAKHYPGLA